MKLKEENAQTHEQSVNPEASVSTIKGFLKNFLAEQTKYLAQFICESKTKTTYHIIIFFT